MKNKVETGCSRKPKMHAGFLDTKLDRTKS